MFLVVDSPPLSIPVAIVLIATAALCAALAYRVPWSGPALLAFLAPFAWYHEVGASEISLVKTASAGVFAGAALALVLQPERRARARAALRGNWPLLLLAAFAALALASVGWAPGKGDAARDALKWWWYALAFATTTVTIRAQFEGLRVAVALLAGAFIVGVYGFWQHMTGTPIVFIAPDGALVGRLTSTLEGPNQFGAYLELAMPVLLAVLLFTRMPRLPFIAGSLLLGLLATDLTLTYSRGAFWSCAVALGFVVAAYVWTKRYGEERHASSLPGIGAVTAACAALVVMPIAGLSVSSEGWRHQIGTLDTTDERGTVMMRQQLWACAERLLVRHPLLGVGAGTFNTAKLACGIPQPVETQTHANQWYLETAADLGLLGLALLLGFLGSLLVRARSPSMWADPVAIGTYAALCAFVLHGFVDDVMPYPKAALALFVMLPLLAAPSDAGGHAPAAS